MTQLASFEKNQEKAANSKLMKAIVIGAVVGGVVAMLDSSTRKKMTTKTKEMKDSTTKMITQVRENPTEVKRDWQERIKTTSAAVKEIINDAQQLYEKVNSTVIEPATQMKEDTSDILSSAKEATEELKGIGSKVKEAGVEIASENETNADVNDSGNVHSIHTAASTTTADKSIKQHG